MQFKYFKIFHSSSLWVLNILRCESPKLYIIPKFYYVSNKLIGCQKINHLNLYILVFAFPFSDHLKLLKSKHSIFLNLSEIFSWGQSDLCFLHSARWKYNKHGIRMFTFSDRKQTLILLLCLFQNYFIWLVKLNFIYLAE